jgi:nucleoside-diphosphate-sugar epimerase
MRALVIGGTLFIGRALVGELRRAGHELAVLHRKASHDLGPDIENLQADRGDAESLRSVLFGRRFDWIFDNVYDWQHGTSAAQVMATVTACGGFARYIFMSSVAAYGQGDWRREEDPLAPDDHPARYVRQKAQSERALFASGAPVSTLRPPFVYGAGNPYYREAFFWDRFRDGRTIFLPDGGARAMQFVEVADLARAAIRVAQSPDAVGQAFNVADHPLSQREWVQELAAVAGRQAQTLDVPRESLLAAGGHVFQPPFYFGEYLDLPPIGQDTAKIRALGWTPTPLREGLRRQYEWWRASTGPAPDYSWEDSLQLS